MNELLQKLAEREYPNNRTMGAQQQAYIAGIEEHVLGFAEWIGKNGYWRSDFAWYNIDNKMIGLETQQLFQTYLKEVK